MRGNMAALKAATQTHLQWMFKAVLIGPYIRNMDGCDYKHNYFIIMTYEKLKFYICLHIRMLTYIRSLVCFRLMRSNIHVKSYIFLMWL